MRVRSAVRKQGGGARGAGAPAGGWGLSSHTNMQQQKTSIQHAPTEPEDKHTTTTAEGRTSVHLQRQRHNTRVQHATAGAEHTNATSTAKTENNIHFYDLHTILYLQTLSKQYLLHASAERKPRVQIVQNRVCVICFSILSVKPLS